MSNNIKTHIESITNSGFTIVENVLSESELSQLRELTDRIIEYAELDLEDPFQGYYIRHRSDQGVLYDLFQRHPEFQKIARNSIVLDILEHLVGSDVFLYENSLVYKPKSRDNAVPWHQDFINRPDEPRKFIAWYALDDVTVSNGAMSVIPGSHKNGFLPWYRVEGETHHTRLKPEFVEEEKAVFAEMKAGSVLVFNQLLVHGSKKIDSNMPRRAYRVSYQGFEQIFTPRGTPIVLRGGSPESLREKFSATYREPEVDVSVQKPLSQKLLELPGRVVRKLVRTITEG